eukprot:gene55634-74288_t
MDLLPDCCPCGTRQRLCSPIWLHHPADGPRRAGPADDRRSRRLGGPTKRAKPWEGNRMRKLTLACLASTSLTVLSAVPLSAMAQTSPQTSPAETATAIEDVIVTADRRERRLQDVPSAITAVTSETLDRQRIVDLGSLSGSVPSFSMTEGTPLGKELNIRGIT